jgi:hypothetical protein
MAEILVRVVDKVNKEFYLNCRCTKRGDVIVVAPDGWKWGTDERTDPQYRIISLPQYSVEDLQAFLAPEQPTDPSQSQRTLQRRAFKFDVDHPDLPQAIRDCIADDTRASETYQDNAVPAAAPDTGAGGAAEPATFDMLAFKVQKAPIEDPAVIGRDAKVMG